MPVVTEFVTLLAAALTLWGSQKRLSGFLTAMVVVPLAAFLVFGNGGSAAGRCSLSRCAVATRHASVCSSRSTTRATRTA